jgi:hypothetical protein
VVARPSKSRAAGALTAITRLMQVFHRHQRDSSDDPAGTG